MSIKKRLLFLLILLLALFFRFYGIDWDNGYHLHPDERMIIMVTNDISLPNKNNINRLLSPQSPVNPKFFAYGSFPIYLLKSSANLVSTATENKWFTNYDGLLYMGRTLSVLFDLLTIVLVYKICQIVINEQKNKKHVFSQYFPFIASFMYATSVFAIQASHFYAVDVTLTFFSTFTIYRLLIFTKKPTYKNIVLTGLAFGLALATKITIILLAAPIAVCFLFLYLKKVKLSSLILYLILLFTFSLLAFTLAMPYALIDFSTFYKQINEQLKMNSDPYIFPFTLQYVGTKAYFYYLKNIIFWGLGIPYGFIAIISSFSLIAFIMFKLFTQKKRFDYVKNNFSIILLSIFFLIYFLLIGKSAVKFMRYLLPLYPLFAIFTSVAFSKITLKIKQRIFIVICYLLFVICLIWPLSFLSIYSQKNTRVLATNWMIYNLPKGSSLATEHWDDMLPLYGGEKFTHLELPLYGEDNKEKWKSVSQTLSKSDYIVIASNRLYTPLQRLSNCSKYKHCFPYTATYYQKLFKAELGFEIEKVFSDYPKIPFFNFEIVDDSADESFTVYDHPKVYIFKNTNKLSSEEIYKKVIK